MVGVTTWQLFMQLTGEVGMLRFDCRLGSLVAVQPCGETLPFNCRLGSVAAMLSGGSATLVDTLEFDCLLGSVRC